MLTKFVLLLLLTVSYFGCAKKKESVGTPVATVANRASKGLHIVNAHRMSNGVINTELSDRAVTGMCEGLWRPENLKGKCTGLQPYGRFANIENAKELPTAAACKAACCSLIDCATWQYDKTTKVCNLGPAVRPAVEKSQCESSGGETEANYDGGRKCLRGFCGGMEDQILANHAEKMKAKGLLPYEDRMRSGALPKTTSSSTSSNAAVVVSKTTQAVPDVVPEPTSTEPVATPVTNKKAGKCAGLWRPEPLPGECPGLQGHLSYSALSHFEGKTMTGNLCKVACCQIGDQCVTWQFNKDTKECKLGPRNVKVGDEVAGTKMVCEQQGNFEGGRKCVKGKCGGKENEEKYLGASVKGEAPKKGRKRGGDGGF